MPMRRRPPGSRFFFISYWEWRDGEQEGVGWMPREALIDQHPLEWAISIKHETGFNFVLSGWQEIDRATYLRYFAELEEIYDAEHKALVDDDESLWDAIRERVAKRRKSAPAAAARLIPFPTLSGTLPPKPRPRPPKKPVG
jgi:hypothetical protein